MCMLNTLPWSVKDDLPLPGLMMYTVPVPSANTDQHDLIVDGALIPFLEAPSSSGIEVRK